MRSVQFLLALLLIPVTVFAFDFKGVALGAPVTPDQILEKLGVRCGAGIVGTQVCNGGVTIARESATLNLVIGTEGNVRRIDLTLSPQSFDVVAPLMIEKFGTPTKTTRSELQTRMGVKVDQITHWWRNDAEFEVSYRKYAGTLDSSNLYFSTKEDREILSKPRVNRRGDL